MGRSMSGMQVVEIDRSRLERYSVRHDWVGPAVVLLVVAILLDAKLWRPTAYLGTRENAQIAEAEAWWNGRLDLPERRWDTALHAGRVYNHFPPMFTILAAMVVPFHRGFPHWLLVTVLVVPTVLLAYTLFVQRTGSRWWGANLSIAFLGGTSLLPVLDRAVRGGGPHFVNQILGVIGLLLVLSECYGRRRSVVAAAGCAIAVWSRQLTVAYLLPFVWLAVRGRSAGAPRRRWMGVAAAVAVIVAVPCGLNTLKFGRPWQFGYGYIYADRPADDFSRDTTAYGLFSTHYIPRNLYYANVGWPEVHRIEVAGESQWRLRPNHYGVGIWWTTPLLVWLLVDARRLWSDPVARAWLIGASLVFAGLMLYHSTGYEQRGFNRYSLDYLPVLFAVIAPSCVRGRRRWVSLGMIVWGVTYFGILLDWPNVRIW